MGKLQRMIYSKLQAMENWIHCFKVEAVHGEGLILRLIFCWIGRRIPSS